MEKKNLVYVVIKTTPDEVIVSVYKKRETAISNAMDEIRENCDELEEELTEDDVFCGFSFDDNHIVIESHEIID